MKVGMILATSVQSTGTLTFEGAIFRPSVAFAASIVPEARLGIVNGTCGFDCGTGIDAWGILDTTDEIGFDMKLNGLDTGFCGIAIVGEVKLAAAPGSVILGALKDAGIGLGDPTCGTVADIGSAIASSKDMVFI